MVRVAIKTINGFVLGERITYTVAELGEDHKWHDVTKESEIVKFDPKQSSYLDPKKGIIECSMIYLLDGYITFDCCIEHLS